ncbi:MAG TPA: valine--tRNA ligase [Candidatus Aphodoplasma excrementigallinarum]|uniref:Valine--tRNA ligase n=1 Tax=Candidatus Aphodoplasma excrementigallinarum TaxID=2840673 RepID=A0A9D1T027_9FIRM|nr:valine--tRNA ligase [Candidatus Aphodoplasma excrementigallinarum]
MNDKNNIAKTYEPAEFESRLYRFWSEAGFFHADETSDKEPFTIVIPPPNVTGQLHMGHALDETLQDILIRYKRMSGYEALWVPGTDHAGIATQIKVEEVLRNEEGKTRYDLGREAFLERVWEWKKKYGDRIISQLKKLGCSCDWDRERFTMDEGCSDAVLEVFVNLYNKGLIYQGNRIINWCPKCTTALSDAEVEYEEQAGHFWYIKYFVKDSDEYLTIATTRPETLLGDTAVAVHPDDERYTHLVGKTLILPLVGREIPVIADEYVDKEFGTGAVKITPAHDPNDFEVGLRHGLEQIKVLNDDATINANGGKYEGLDRYEARKQIVKDLEDGGYLIKIEDHTHNVGQCYRCGTTVEPITSKQWFVKMKPLAEEAIKIVTDGRTKFVPERFTKTYLNWMENVHDWCISRQLWWGHRIPAYYCDACGETVVSKTHVDTCPKCGAPMRQDPDVLDTWFSSALWPFSTLGWPKQTKELEKFFPTSVLVTGYDIIFFWVARMIFSSAEHMGKEPFKYVFIHGLVRDEQGRKMSKSLGNGIDPLEIIEQYGADALRFTLVTGNAPGNDMRFSEKKVQASRNFANKIWNASRFVLMNLEIGENKLPDAGELQLEDKWIISRFNRIVKEVTENLDKFELGVALAKIYDFIWDDYCDWYIELVKPRLFDKENDTRDTAQYVLTYVLSETMKLLHPFMPFITEEIWQHLPHDGESIMVSEWPRYDAALDFAQDEKNMSLIMEAIKSIRNTRSEMNVPPSKKCNVIIVTQLCDVFSAGVPFFEKLAGAQSVAIVKDNGGIGEGAVCIVVEGASIYLPMDELVDKKKEIERLEKEKANLLSEIKRVEGKLSNKGFTDKAPAAVVAAEEEKGKKYSEMLKKVEESLAALQ